MGEFDKEKSIAAHIGKMRNGTKKRRLVCPYFPETPHNMANLKQHMIHNSCANEQAGTQAVQWGDIVGHNPTQEAEEANRNDKGTFAKTEILFGGIQVANQEEGVVRKFNSRISQADTRRKLRNRLSVARRRKNVGSVYCP